MKVKFKKRGNHWEGKWFTGDGGLYTLFYATLCNSFFTVFYRMFLRREIQKRVIKEFIKELKTTK